MISMTIIGVEGNLKNPQKEIFPLVEIKKLGK